MDQQMLEMCKRKLKGTPVGKNSSVHYKSQVRFDKAKEQASKDPVSVDAVIKYVNEFYDKLGLEKCSDPKKENPIINKEFYQNIKNEYGLKSAKDIVWMIFTKDGYLGVVALSNDINFDIAKNKESYLIPRKRPGHHTTKGILVHSVGKEWDKSFVLIFPLKNLPSTITKHDVERGIGNYLISKDVPIIDYYSHNY